MPSRRARTKAKQISYVEVDSDIDLSDGEKKQVEDQVGRRGKKRVNNNQGSDGEDEYGTAGARGGSTKRDRKKSRNSTKSSKKSKYDAKILLDIPFDIFAEVCTHLRIADLMNLAKVNKSLHANLLSRSSRSIWAAIRKRDGFALFEGMTELEFAVFVANTCCQGCSARSYFHHLVYLRSNLCKECRSERVITRKDIKKQWPDLHPRAIECVRFDQGGDTGVELGDKASTRFLIEELALVNDELLELEEEEEIAQIALETVNRKSTSRSRGHGVVSQVTRVDPRTSLVEAYVREKADWIREQQKLSNQHKVNEVRLRIKRWEEAREVRNGPRDSRWETFEIYSDILETMGWSLENLVSYRCEYVYQDLKRVPKVSPLSDEAQWERYRQHLQSDSEQVVTENELRGFLVPFYDSLKVTESRSRNGIFPACSEFDSLASIKTYLGDRNSKPMTKSLWLKLLPSILSDLDDYCDCLRAEAVRAILSAQQGVSVTKLSSSPTDYPRSQYPDSFFDLATSQFPPPWLPDSPDPQPYPAAATNGRYAWNGKGTFSRLAESRMTLTIQAMLDAARLDPSTTTVSDLDAVGRRFTWDNDPTVSKRNVLHTWKELIRVVRDRGPNKTKYRDGSACTLVSYFPQVDVDGATYLARDGDRVEDSVVDSDEEGQNDEMEDH